MANIIEKVSKENKDEETVCINHEVENYKNATSSQKELGASPKTPFMKEFEQGITIEESRKKVYAKIDGLWNK